MKDKVEKAILNNNDLYEAVFEAQKINFNRNDSIRYCLEKTPPLYSNLVTVSTDWKPDEIFGEIDEKSKNENWEEWSIKDSFSVLDLTDFGFEKLFDANWFYLEAAKFEPIKNDLDLSYKMINSEELLNDWRIAWNSDEQLGKAIFHPNLLNNSKVFFVAGYKENRIVSGCLINKTEDVFGISNFFSPDSKIEYWSEIFKFAYDSIEFADIVGYEREFFVKEIQPLGFEATGDLTVWLRNSWSNK